MRTTFLLPVLFALLLSACNSKQTNISTENQNPLTASRYGDELADTMANLIITNDPIIQDASMRKVVEAEIGRGKDIAESARFIQGQGIFGTIIPIKGDTTGIALYVDDTLYLSSDFSTDPGPSIHVYLTTIVDPRDAVFPDASTVDLGELQAVYGAQQYAVPKQKNTADLRTFVLYDTKLKMLYGFAQISKTY